MALTKEREKEFAQFAEMKKAFDRIADSNGLKGKARQRAAFYFMQGITSFQTATTNKVDPMMYIALLRNDINELVYKPKEEKNNEEANSIA